MTDEGSLRERLIDVGVELVLAEGTASVGLREIARRAGVSHGAPRRYFPTHHALLSAIARRGFEDLGARFAAAVADAPTPRAQLDAFARVYVGYALERRGMFELMYRHDLLDGGQQDSGLPRLRESTLPQFARIVELVGRCAAEQAAARRRPVRPDGVSPPPSVTAAALWSNLHGIAQLWAWGSLQLVLDAPSPSPAAGQPDQLDRLDRLVAAVLDAHLGPAGP